MQLLISDANIIIDLEEGDLIESLFCLSFDFAVPDVLFYEELEEQHSYLEQLGLQIKELSSESLEYTCLLVAQYKKPSRNDCLALALARQERCPLLTGDKELRQVADVETVIVKGTIWVVEQLIKQNLLSVNDAHEAYKKMKLAGRRLPWEKALNSLDEQIKQGF